MSDASVVFLPWVRQGLAARIAVPDPVTSVLPAGAPLGVSLAVNGAPAASMSVRLHGPADIIGIDPRQVVRTEPAAGTPDYESNDLAAVEFDNPDLPWLFTPAAADPQGRLRPWLVLVVVRRQEGVRLRPPRNEPLPVLEIAPPAVPAAELPDLADSWAWAHAQLSTREGGSESDLRTVLATRPELSVGRLLCPRLLAPFTDYLACVVPAFEAGRLAGLGAGADGNAPLTPAWSSGESASATVTLPVYYHWEFCTGAREDFESMVARLAPRDLSNAVGRRAMDISQPGFRVPPMPSATVLLEGALQPIDAPRAVWPNAPTTAWQQALQSIVNAANARATALEAEPVVGPPIYGRWYAGRHEVGTVPTRSWLDELNLDPRERVVAALGTRVIQQQQEELMASAWEQAGEIARVNQRLRQMQLSLAINSRLHARHVARMDDDDTLWRFAAPAQARLVLPASTPGTAPMTMSAMLAASSTPQVTLSAAMRRLSRPGGAISRRATTAMVLAGAQTPGTVSTTNVSAMFTLFSAQPQIMMFTLPPTRGLVSFDAVTRRLAAEFAEMNYARATDLAVVAAPKRPAFVVTGEPIRVTGLTHELGAVLPGRTLRTARRARRPGPDGGELPDLPEPEEEPERPHPLPPPRVDSADAQAFREAAVRHLARVNPQPTFFVPQPLVRRPVLEAASARVQVRELLDPAPALQMRMAATIRIAGPEAPREIGPLGASPVFTQPMSEPLAALSQDWLLPGLERVPPDTVALLEPNERFIEAFVLGLNVEMGRELLWRDFPVDDPRATYFRHFWRAVNPAANGDIARIAEWAERALGGNAATGAGIRQVVLLVRSGLFRRYPNAVVYAVPAVRVGNGRKPGDQADERHPLFRGALQPDVSFFGFALDPTEATGDPGWYFVIQQQPTEPRFGFDVEIDFGGASHVPLTAPPAGHAMPAGTQWARNAAHMARIIRQQPVRVAIHAGELITP
jgi:hypothetical protein